MKTRRTSLLKITRLSLFTILACQFATADDADTIYHNGVILTMEGGEFASAIAIQGELIIAVGGDEILTQLGGQQTIAVDLEGRTIMPGFVDPHNHAFSQAEGDLAGAQQLALSHGITTMAEFYADDRIMQAVNEFDQAGELRMRVSMYPLHVDACGVQ